MHVSGQLPVVLSGTCSLHLYAGKCLLHPDLHLRPMPAAAAWVSPFRCQFLYIMMMACIVAAHAPQYNMLWWTSTQHCVKPCCEPCLDITNTMVCTFMPHIEGWMADAAHHSRALRLMLRRCMFADDALPQLSVHCCCLLLQIALDMPSSSGDGGPSPAGDISDCYGNCCSKRTLWLHQSNWLRCVCACTCVS